MAVNQRNIIVALCDAFAQLTKDKADRQRY